MTFVAGLASCGFMAVAGEPAAPVKTNAWPHFQEVMHLLRAELHGVTESHLNEAMVEGFLKQMSPQVLIDATSSDTSDSTGSIARSARRSCS